MAKTLLIVDVSPLWELQFTGISNVVYELAKRFLSADIDLDVQFSVFHRLVDRHVISKCLDERSGSRLRTLFEDIASLKTSAQAVAEHGGFTASLSLHVKPGERVFDLESQLFYDFSFLSVPECHHPDTIHYHSQHLTEQVKVNDLIFTISQSTADDLSFYFDFPPDKVEVALLGLHINEESAWDFKRRLGGRDVEPYLICVGTIEPRKNNRIILAWLSRNSWFLREWRFVFVGRDAWGESFDELVAEFGLQAAVKAGRILHVGYVTESQKTALLLGSSGLIFPSLFEGFGLPVLEAMGLGVPVAASCSTSIPEVLGPDGIYFDPYCIDSFDAALHQLISERSTDAGKLRSLKLLKRSSHFSYDKCFDVIVNRLIAEMSIMKRSPGRQKRKIASA